MRWTLLRWMRRRSSYDASAEETEEAEAMEEVEEVEEAEEAEEAEALSKKEGALDKAVAVEEGLSSSSSSTAVKEGGSSSPSSPSSSGTAAREGRAAPRDMELNAHGDIANAREARVRGAHGGGVGRGSGGGGAQGC